MGIYVFSWDKAREYLIADAADETSSHDFGKNVIPAMLAGNERLFAYRFEGYWRDVGTIDSLWEANMDMLEESSGLDMSDESWKIYSRNPNLPSARIGTGAALDGCMIAEGCCVEGTVKHSVLFQGVQVGKGATVIDSIVMRGAHIDDGAVVERAVVAERAHICAGAHVGAAGGALAVLGSDSEIAPGATVAPGASVEPKTTVE